MPETGRVQPTFEAGELLLSGEDGEAFRLSFEGVEASRPLAAGVYVLRTYRMLQEARGESWHVSVTAPRLREVVVRAGETTILDLPEEIHLTGRLGGGQAGMQIADVHGAGLSIYKEGRRIPIDYRVVGSGDEVLARGRMRYG